MELYRHISSRLMGSLYAGFTHESYCLKFDKTTIPIRHLRRSISGCRKIPNLFAFLIFPIYINSSVVNFAVLFSLIKLIENRYFSANTLKTRQVKSYLRPLSGEMYPVGLCIYILPDACIHNDSRLLEGPST